MLSVRQSFSKQHIKSAIFFANSSFELENSFDPSEFEKYVYRFAGFLSFNREFEEIVSKNTAFVTGAIFCSVAFVEATINDFYLQSIDVSGLLRDLGHDSIRRIAEKWEKEINNPNEKHFTIKGKYQTALECANKKRFTRKDSVSTSLDLLVKLRNELVHFEPEWINTVGDGQNVTEEGTIQEMEDLLKGLFRTNVFYELTETPFFPNRCLGHGCAKWAVQTSMNFVDAFYKRIGLKSPVTDIDLILQ